MLHHLSELSLWEISHYWHGHEPDKTTPKALPLEVQNTLRVLAAASSRALYFRCRPNTVYYQAFSDNAWAVRSIASIYQRELQRTYKLRRFKKKFLDSLTISRTALAKWCLKTHTPLPEFWFSSDDPLTWAKAEELDETAALSHAGHFVLFPLFKKTGPATPSSETAPEETLETSSSSLEGIDAQKKILGEEISRIARQNALAKYEPLYDLKRRFIRFYLANTFGSQTDAARRFFDSLNDQEKIDLVPSYDDNSPDTTPPGVKAIRTLTGALREFKQGKNATWLDGFTP